MNESGKNKKRETIKRRQRKQQEMFLEQLQKVPIIMMACNRADISRATYYRWREDYPDFAEAVDEVLPKGIEQVNDMAEAVIINTIKNGNLRAAEFWLKNHKDEYRIRKSFNLDSSLHNEVEKMRNKLKDFFKTASKMWHHKKDDS